MRKLGDVCEIIMGQSPDGDSYNVTGEGVPLINGPVEFSQDAVGRTIRSKFTTQPTKFCRENDLILCVRGSTTGRMNIAGFDACVGRGVAAIRAKEYQPWINYFTLSKRDDIHRLGTGATFPNVSGTMLSDLKLLFPPFSEQQRIVRMLDEAFDRIATAKANAEKNLQNARALFESHLQSVFAQRHRLFAVSIDDVAEVFDGPHATPKTVDAGPVFLGISALQDGNVNLSETRHVTAEDFRKWTRRVRPQAGDIVFSYETRLGQAAIIPEGLVCCLGRRMGLVRVDRTKVDPRFFVYEYISPPFREYLSSRTVRGATVDRIALKEFPSFPITLPPLVEQKRMADRFDALRAETKRLESIYRQKLTALDELKKSLLHQAFTGEL